MSRPRPRSDNATAEIMAAIQEFGQGKREQGTAEAMAAIQELGESKRPITLRERMAGIQELVQSKRERGGAESATELVALFEIKKGVKSICELAFADPAPELKNPVTFGVYAAEVLSYVARDGTYVRNRRSAARFDSLESATSFREEMTVKLEVATELIVCAWKEASR